MWFAKTETQEYRDYEDYRITYKEFKGIYTSDVHHDTGINYNAISDTYIHRQDLNEMPEYVWVLAEVGSSVHHTNARPVFNKIKGIYDTLLEVSIVHPLVYRDNYINIFKCRLNYDDVSYEHHRLTS